MFPKFIKIRQIKESECVDDVAAAIRASVESLKQAGKLDPGIFAGKTTGIAVGSRGIANLPLIVRTLVEIVREAGGRPVVFAAMGSHGDGMAEGQREVLASLGVTEESIGTEIRTCADSVEYGTGADGTVIYGNPLALEFDRIVLFNRVKEHTDFEDITESGIYKLMAIGIGNPAGARIIHTGAICHGRGYGPCIREAGDVMLKKLPVAFALAVTENWKHQTDYVEAIDPRELLEAESRILARSKKRAGRLPVEELDALIVQECGKQYSGTCIDTKVCGRIMINGQKEPASPRIKGIAVLDVTEETHGNTMGLGIADVISRRLFDKINIHATGLTGLTSSCVHQAKIPCVVPDDRMAMDVAFTISGHEPMEDADAILIHDTTALEYMYASEHLWKKIREREDIETLGELMELPFDENGALQNMW